MRTRKATVIAASVGVAVAAATGVTYASSALESAPQSASIVQDAAPVAPRGGNGTGTEAGSNASPDPGGKEHWGDKRGEARGEARGEGRGEARGEARGENRGEGRGDDRGDGRIMINERTYAATPGSCVAVINLNAAGGGAVGPTSFNIRNESDKTVEFFNGVSCDNGAPIATVGPRSSATAITTTATVPAAIAGSFRVIHEHHGFNGHH